MEINLTKDELNTLQYSLYGSLRNLVANKRRVNEQYGEDFDAMFERITQKYMALIGRIYDALTLLEDQER